MLPKYIITGIVLNELAPQAQENYQKVNQRSYSFQCNHLVVLVPLQNSWPAGSSNRFQWFGPQEAAHDRPHGDVYVAVRFGYTGKFQKTLLREPRKIFTCNSLVDVFPSSGSRILQVKKWWFHYRISHKNIIMWYNKFIKLRQEINTSDFQNFEMKFIWEKMKHTSWPSLQFYSSFYWKKIVEIEIK